MGEFPEPAIRGSTAMVSASTPTTSSGSNQPSLQATNPSSSAGNPSPLETEMSMTPRLLSTVSKAATSFSHASNTGGPSTTIEPWAPDTSALPLLPTTTSIHLTLTNQQTSVAIPRSTWSQVVTPASIAKSLSTSPQLSGTPVSTTMEESESANPETSSLTKIITRPIITPTRPPPLSATAPTANSHLSFGAIVGVVGVIIVVLAVAGTCIILGPRRALRKVGIGANGDEEKDYEEWEREHRVSEKWERRAGSIGSSSDWWRPPPRPFPTRPSTVSMGGPGMAGVGAGKGMGIDENPTSPIPKGMSRRRVEERGAVRSGWFAASMVRGASLLSLGSLVRHPSDSSNGRGSERMSRMGTGGSAGKRFQELYRRERASGASTMRTNQPTEYLATVNEIGEHRPSGAGQHRAPGEMDYRTRSIAPRARRPSRLTTSYVPEIVVQDTTLPNLSSVSIVTYESGGRGYDADAEAEQRSRVF
ncbi:hypothetical protein OPQ81_006305 [Rhizoctonia solani]|nr:hypothetical protein OPQ81_006305 [Rhizoctonia solani]